MNQLGAILLAAGGSQRLGQSKQLLKLEGQVLVRRRAELLLEQGFASVVVVTGAVQKEVQEALCGLAVQVVHNDRWQEGMGSSLACGIAAMPERVRGALLLLCDQWKITAEDLQALVQAWQHSPAKAITAEWSGSSAQVDPIDKPRVATPAEVSGPIAISKTPALPLVSGPPVIFPRACFSRLVKLRGDRGAQQILKHHKAGVERVPLPHAAFDIDRPSDLPKKFD